MVAYVFAIKFFWGNKPKTRDDLKQRVLAMDERAEIKDPAMVRKSLIVLSIIIGFVFHGKPGFQPATIGFCGTALLLFLSNTKGAAPHPRRVRDNNR
jgi:Na+/H+ antiporter NhaD/arsenite permease-like protein